MISSIKSQLYHRHQLAELYDEEAEQMIVQLLPRLTREELLMKNNSAVLKKVGYFCKLSSEIVNSLALKLKKLTYSP